MSKIPRSNIFRASPQNGYSDYPYNYSELISICTSSFRSFYEGFSMFWVIFSHYLYCFVLAQLLIWFRTSDFGTLIAGSRPTDRLDHPCLAHSLALHLIWFLRNLAHSIKSISSSPVSTFSFSWLDIILGFVKCCLGALISVIYKN